jgi:O-antigen/teichoic acid export membrane protein
LKGSLFKNFLSLAGAEAFSKVITFAAFAIIARLCGPAGFGYIEWAGALLMCASLVVDQGFSSYGAREIAKAPGRTAELVNVIVTARVVLAGIGFIAVLTFAFAWVNDPSVRMLVIAYGLSLWGLPFLFQWVFQGHEKMNLAAVTQVIRQTVFVITVLVFVKGTDSVVWAGIAETAGVVAAAVFSIWMYQRYFAGGAAIRPAFSKQLFNEGTPIGLSQLFWVVKMFGATLVVGLIATPEDTGYFAGAMRILVAVHTFVWLYYFNLLPSMSREWKKGAEKLASLIGNSMKIVLPGSIIAAAIWIAFAPTAMAIAFGPNFIAGATALRWMAGVCMLAAVSGHYRFGLIAAGRQKDEMLTSALGAVTALILIPLGYSNAGIGGAAAALFIAETVTLLSAWYLSRQRLFSPRPAAAKVCDEHLGGLPEASV